jgi:predicted O-methyltransferase YrrM
MSIFEIGEPLRDYPFSFEKLKTFSEGTPYLKLNEQERIVFNELKANETKYNFPAIKNDVGSFINFIFKWHQPKRIFEFGSGYGQSAFWYLLNNNTIDKIILTEKRDDLESVFQALSWPKQWYDKLEYHQDDAFKVFNLNSGFDFILIDGVKADYLKFLEECYDKLNDNGLVLIDNSFWRGSFLDDEVVQKKQTAMNIKLLHEFIAQTKKYESIFIPFEDGVSLLRKI